MTLSTIKKYLSRLAGPSLLAILFALTGTGGAHAASDAITGTVTNQSDTGVQNVSVTATNPGGSTVEFGPSTTAPDGSYELDVNPGTYDIHFMPPSGSGYNPVVESNYVASGNQMLNVQFTPGTHTLSGTLTDQNGTPIAKVGIQLSVPNGPNAGQATTDANGHYVVTVAPGMYVIEVVSGSSRGDSTGAIIPTDVYGYGVSDSTPIDLTSGDQTQNLQILTSTLTVLVKDANGNPLSGVQFAGSWNAPQTALIPGSSNGSGSESQVNGYTDSAGAFVLTVLTGSVIRSSDCAYPNNIAVCGSGQVVNGSTTIELDEPILYTLSGTLADQNGTPIANDSVFLSIPGGAGDAAQATTDINGHYAISAPPNTYTINVRGDSSQANPTGAVVPSGESGYGLSDSTPIDLAAGSQTQNLQISTSTLTVIVKDANGNPLSGVQFFGYWNAPHTALIPGSSISSGSESQVNGYTDSTGTVVFTVLTGSVIRSSDCAYPSNIAVCGSGQVVNGSTTIELDEPILYTLSGTLTDQNGTPIANVGIQLSVPNGPNAGQATTDANGHYVVTVAPGMYVIEVVSGSSRGDSTGAIIPTDVYGYGVSDSTPIELTTGDQTQNLQISTVVLTVTVKDVNGNPLSGIEVYDNTLNAPHTALIPGSSTGSGSEAQVNGYTDSTGTVSFRILAGSTLNSNVCAIVDNLNVCFNGQEVANGNASIVFQQEPPALAAPTGLNAATPTDHYPALMWNAVSGAASYNVYRNGTLVGSSTTANFTDTTVPGSASYTYTVTDVSSANVESAQSSPFTVVYDITPPTESGLHLSSGLILLFGSETISVHYADNLSGVVAAMYYVDQNPATNPHAVGHAMTLSGTDLDSGTASATDNIGLLSLPLGTNTIYVRVEDAAGNWSTVESASFPYIG